MSDNPEAPPDVGGAPTQPGQTEVVAGSVEHERLLNLYPNASSYGPTHNVVLGPPTVVDRPYVEQAGDRLTCTMGNWNGEPTSYVYQWVIDGVTGVGDGTADYVFSPEDVGHSAMCIVTATSDAGTSQGAPSNSVVIADPLQWEQAR